jgi:hypothetical protein
VPTSFQQHLDALLGQPAPRKCEQAQGEELIARERIFCEQASSTEEPGQRRMDSEEQRPTLLYDVVWHRGRWRIRHLGKHSAPFSDQAAAIDAAWKLARKKQGQGHVVEVHLHRTDGEIVMPPARTESDQ